MRLTNRVERHVRLCLLSPHLVLDLCTAPAEGLELPSSDVDVVVCGINGMSYSYGGSRAGYTSMQTVANLQKLANVLQEQGWVRGMKVRHPPINEFRASVFFYKSCRFFPFSFCYVFAFFFV